MNEKRKGDTVAVKVPQRSLREELDEALAQLPGEYDDPEYVVEGMRSHFGGTFTAEDEKRVRELVKPKATGNGGGAQPQRKLEVGATGQVLDWTRDPNKPVTCSAKVTHVNRDGTIDVDVTPPEGIEPYAQVGLVEHHPDEQQLAQVPGTWRWPS